ncbi:MAG: hypothetical protein J0I06_12860 [Planctomycetes bacterium]|nr:hypothetical protein [Planctomycetota bacterium]
MRRRMLVLASVALVAAFVGCRHRCHKLREDCCPPSGPAGTRSPILLPPAGVPTTPGGPSPAPPVTPGGSGYLPPAAVTPPGPAPAPNGGGPQVLFPDPLPGSSSSRPGQPGAPSIIGGPAKPTAEPPKAPAATGLPGYTKVKDGLFAGGKPTLDGFDSLKNAGFRTVIYLHAAGADVSAVKDMASTRDLNFVAIETTPETLADANKQFDRLAGDRLTRPAYVFADDPVRAGAVWYLHFRTADALGDDVARLRARPLGLSDEGEEGRNFSLAIQRILATR